MNSETVIQVENLVKTYRLGKVSIPALRGISFDVTKGEFLAVIGPSGSGKTTLLNLLGAIDKPTDGRIFIDGRGLLHGHHRIPSRLT